MEINQPEPPFDKQSCKDNFEQALMTGEIKPIAKCLFKNCYADMSARIEELEKEVSDIAPIIEALEKYAYKHNWNFAYREGKTNTPPMEIEFVLGDSGYKIAQQALTPKKERT